MIKCGIIGYGKMGKIRAHALEASGQAVVSCVYDKSLTGDVPYRVAETPKEIIHSSDIDAVIICTPNYLIPELCIKSLEAGKHVFSEKPPGFNADDVKRVIDAEKVATKKLMYGFNHRHHKSIKNMKRIVDSGELGRVLWMRGRYGKEVDEKFFEGWRADPKLAGGGILLDQGIHMLDLFLHLGSTFDQVSAFVSNLYWKINGIEDNVFAIYRNTHTGLCASLHSTMTQWRYLFSLEVFLEGGALVLNGLKTSSGAYGDEHLTVKRNASHLHDGRFEAEESVVYHHDTSWDSEMRHFIECVATDSPVKYGHSSDALELMKLVDATYASNGKC
jgi:1,5-anhydro-D-fructose reductase (1,5-anhydro-D-mannitol-forming)